MYSVRGEVKNVHNIPIGKPEGNRPLGRPTRRWKNIKWILRKK